MAIGAAKMLGITVMENFRSPFFSTSVRAFWKKWHISFTSWLKEYIYFPLGGSRKGKWRTYYNILVVYVVSGLWHGAAWTYVVWAFLNGLMQVVESLCEPVYKKLLKILHISEKNKLLLVVEFLFTFAVIAIIRIFFRAEDLGQARFVVGQLAGVFIYGVGGLNPTALGVNLPQLAAAGALCAVCLGVDAAKALGKDVSVLAKSRVLYYILAAAIVVCVALLGIYGEGFDPQAFIYFQF